MTALSQLLDTYRTAAASDQHDLSRKIIHFSRDSVVVLPLNVRAAQKP